MTQLKDTVYEWLTSHREEFLSDLKSLIEIPSVEGKASDGMPYGEDCAKALDTMLSLCQRYGLKTKNFDYLCVLIRINMKVAVIMGSTSDLDIMSQAITVLEDLGVEVVKKVISAHRTPDLMCEFAKSAKANGIGAIIAGAGGAAHVAGVVAGMTTVPVIGVPIQTKALGGMDSLLSIVQMPAGIPVATMAINGAKNAGLFAAQILALTDAELSARLDEFRRQQTQKVLDATI